MKKLILVFMTLAITSGVYAQNDSASKSMATPVINNTNNLNQHSDINHHQKDPIDPLMKGKSDGVMMHQGKMMIVRNGEAMILDSDLTLANGTTVLSDGTWIQKDGTKKMLKEGQYIDMAGNMSEKKSENKIEKDKTIYLVPDSTIDKNKKK